MQLLNNEISTISDQYDPEIKRLSLHWKTRGLPDEGSITKQVQVQGYVNYFL